MKLIPLSSPGAECNWAAAQYNHQLNCKDINTWNIERSKLQHSQLSSFWREGLLVPIMICATGFYSNTAKIIQKLY